MTIILATEDCICFTTKIKNHKPKKNHIRCDFVLNDLVCLCVLIRVEVCGFDPLLENKCNLCKAMGYLIKIACTYVHASLHITYFV